MKFWNKKEFRYGIPAYTDQFQALSDINEQVYYQFLCMWFPVSLLLPRKVLNYYCSF
jgi:hypothetical protein